jgi:DnaJ-class molecular chaperone
MRRCKDCNGKGYNYSDPDHKMLECDSCNGEGMIPDEDDLDNETIELMIRGDDPDKERDERMER